MKELNLSEIEKVSGGRISYIVLRGLSKIASTALSQIDWTKLTKPSDPPSASDPYNPLSPSYNNW